MFIKIEKNFNKIKRIGKNTYANNMKLQWLTRIM